MLASGVTQRRAGAKGPASEAPEEDVTSFGAFHAAAAVLSSFDRSALNPVSADLPASTDDEVIEVLADSTPVRDPEGKPMWKLLADVRRDLLQRMGSREAIQLALDANPERPHDDPVQTMFEAFVDGSAPPLEEHDLGQLAATFEIAQWLDGLDLSLGSKVPDASAIRSRSDYLTLLHPFEQLAGTNFAGRATELQELRDYVGVLPPGSFRQRTIRAAREIFNLTDKPPLFIDGPGGVGKSALISRFIWEHATIKGAQQFPFVYLDFDRVRLQPDEPLTLLIEAVRQIGLQYEEARPYAERVRATWQDELLARYSESALASSAAALRATVKRRTPATAQGNWDRYVADFGSLLRNVREGRDPCLMVLDTFEEVQYRGDVVVAGLCEFLEGVQRLVPRLRIVMAGRAPLTLEGFPTKPLPLGDFDDAAARLFLEKRGVGSSSLAKRIIKRVGRSPLSLQLAAMVVQRAEETGEAEAFDLQGRGGASLTEAQIQGLLYRRILQHIRDDAIAQLAYPGLALRRVTPDIIQRVLADPCKVPVPDEATAQDLFDRLAREVSLVHLEDGALVHRRDVRRMMLPLLRDAESGAVRRIEKAAIDYYASRDGAADRAEEIYHRLSRHQPLADVAARWTDDAKPYLFNALDEQELGARERAWLLQRLDPERQLDEEERAAADLETWEWDTEVKVRELLDHNRLAAALQELRARSERSPGSPLYATEADTLGRMQHWSEAGGVLAAGIDSAGEKGDTGLVIDLLTGAAGVSIRLGDLDAARSRLAEADELLSDRPDDGPRALRVGLAGLEIERRDPSEDPDHLHRLEQDVKSRLDRLTDAQLRGHPELAAWAAADLGPGSPEVLRRVLDLLGLPLRPGQRRALAGAIAKWDDAASQAANRWKGVLGGDDLPWAETLTKAWTQLLRDLSPPAAGARISALLAQAEPPPDVLAALEHVMVEQAAPVILRATVAEPVPGPVAPPKDGSPPPEDLLGADPYADAPLKLSGPGVAQLTRALADAFPSRTDLATMLQTRLDRSLDSIAFTDDLMSTCFQLVEASRAEGWTASLLAAAIDAKPQNVALRAIGETFGLVTFAPVEPLLGSDAGRLGTAFDVPTWRSRLAAREAHVCRVAVGPKRFATGFLVGPDLLLTAQHAVHEVIDGHVRPHDVHLLFDVRTLIDGETVSRGTPYHLSEDWLVSASPPGDLDYALLRVAGAPGNDPIGGDRAEPGAMPRDWIMPPRRAYDFLPGSPLLVLHHARGGTLQVAVNMEGVIGLDAGGTRVRYRTDTAPGSAGAPCFDMNWELLALHVARDKTGVNEGVPISAILRDLEAQGVAAELYRAPV